MLALVALVLSLAAAPPARAAATASASTRSGNEGLLYGRVTTRDGETYQGRLRWDDEEASWGDLFNSAKRDNPWLADAPVDARPRERRHKIEIFGFEIGSFGEYGGDDTRVFISRFGDIAQIEPGKGDALVLTLKDGAAFRLEGGSNDVGATIRIWDAQAGTVDVGWHRIRRIELMPTPASLGVAPRRLHGKVETHAGTFTGFIQWDQDECLGSDELDGEDDEGDDVSLRFDKIRSIAHRSSKSSLVTLEDGRTMVLSGSNDVDRDNRGIYVDDARYGRVLVPWDEFERVDLDDAGSGPGYDSYAKGERIAGTVTTSDGKKLTGLVVYDLDESETTEMLNGNRQDVEYNIPFYLVASVEPRRSSAKVTLTSGEELSLDGVTDVSEENAGLLVFVPGQGKPAYVPWNEVERVDFAGPSKR